MEDPEGVVYNPDTGTLYIGRKTRDIGGDNFDTIFEVTTSGSLVRCIERLRCEWQGRRSDCIRQLDVDLESLPRRRRRRSRRCNTEDVTAAWIDSNGAVHLSVRSSFTIPGLSGDSADIFTCTPQNSNPITSCTFEMFWDGSAHGFGGESINGMFVAG